MPRRLITAKTAIAGALVLFLVVLAGCGPGTGYPTAQAACEGVGSGVLVTTKSGAVKVAREKDEAEYSCLINEDNPRYALVVEQSINDEQDRTPNSFYPDEDTILDLATGQELPRDVYDAYDSEDSDWE